MISIPGSRLYFQDKAQAIEYTKNKEEEERYLIRMHPKRANHNPKTRRLVNEEVEYIIRIYRSVKPDMEGFKEILSHSGYNYTTKLPTTILSAPDLAARKDIKGPAVSVLIYVRLESEQLRIICRSEEIDRRLPFRYNNKIAKISNAIRKTPDFKMWRDDVMQRDGYKCRICGRGLKELYDLNTKYDLNIKLNVHHQTPLDYIINEFEITTPEEALRYYKPELFDLKNGITCCEICHRRYFHRNGTESNKNLH